MGLDVSYHGVYRPRTAADGNTTSVESNNDDDEERLFYERKQQLEEMREQQRSKLRRRILMMDLNVFDENFRPNRCIAASKGLVRRGVVEHRTKTLSCEDEDITSKCC